MHWKPFKVDFDELNVIKQKGSVDFHHDSARPFTNLVTCQKLLSLEYDAVPQIPNSPDLATLDYYLFGFFKIFTVDDNIKPN